MTGFFRGPMASCRYKWAPYNGCSARRAPPSVAVVAAVLVRTLPRRSRRFSVRLHSIGSSSHSGACRAHSIAGRSCRARCSYRCGSRCTGAPRPSSRPATANDARVALHRRRCRRERYGAAARLCAVVARRPTRCQGRSSRRARVRPRRTLCPSTPPTGRCLCGQVSALRQAVPCLAVLRRESCSSCSPTSSPAW